MANQALALQGLHRSMLPNAECLDHFTNRELQDLAGNMFAGPHFLLAIAVSLAVFNIPTSARELQSLKSQALSFFCDMRYKDVCLLFSCSALHALFQARGLRTGAVDK